jgi:hypothetical protein
MSAHLLVVVEAETVGAETDLSTQSPAVLLVVVVEAVVDLVFPQTHWAVLVELQALAPQANLVAMAHTTLLAVEVPDFLQKSTRRKTGLVVVIGV